MISSAFQGRRQQSEGARLKARTITPGAFFMTICDGKFIDEDLSEEGNAFAKSYFKFETDALLGDYTSAFPDELPSLYHVPDSWDTFEILKPIFDRRFAQWKAVA